MLMKSAREEKGFRIDPLETINIPNTETMRSFSLHFQTSVAPYEQHLSALEKNQEPVAANWQGDASVAYVQKNLQLVSIGRMHIEQMQQASHIFDHTANLFDEGNGLQDMAKWQWGMGMAAETALAFPVASSWYILAQKTQEGALAAVESARAYFNSGFAALHEQITATPGVGGTHDKTFVPNGVSVPKDSEPYAGYLPINATGQFRLKSNKPWTWSDRDLRALKSSEFGAKALERIKQYNVKVIEGKAGNGSFYDQAKNTITLDPQERNKQSTFVHESNHVEFYWRKKNAGFWAKTE